MSPRRARILVLDDEPQMLRAIERLLRSLDVTVTYERDPARALLSVSVFTVDVVIVDFALNVAITGIEFLESVRKSSPKTIRVLMSGKAGDETLLKARESGLAHHVLEKPWASGELQRLMSELAATAVRPEVAGDMRDAPLDVDRLRAFSGAVRAFSADMSSYRVVLDAIARNVAELIGNFCGIGLVSDDGKHIERVANYHKDPETLAFIRELVGGAPLSVDSPSASTQVLASQEGMLIADLDPESVLRQLDPGLHEGARRLHLRSMVLAPMRVDGRVIGILSIVRHGEGVGPLDEEDLSVAQSLADHAALAVTHARTVQALKAEVAARDDLAGHLLKTEALLAELTSPVLELEPRLLLVPIVGVFDAGRARRLAGALLDAVAHKRARAVVVDVTGLPFIDRGVAAHLASTMKAAQLMGAKTFLCGISADAAAQLVEIADELHAVIASDLNDGVVMARAASS
jgi:anti-anti-sigma regulatory factor/CheY-like chemotaxis protein